jgi:N-acetylglutamate synthase-like GNAT family acetyltransferase
MKMSIVYKYNEPVTTEALIEVFKKSGINRPVEDKKRIQTMLDHGNILITAWNGSQLVGLARSLTDFSFCCYLSDLAVDQAYQKSGIGKQLIEKTREVIGKDISLILLSAPGAMDYYPKVGFSKIENGYIIRRET